MSRNGQVDPANPRVTDHSWISGKNSLTCEYGKESHRPEATPHSSRFDVTTSRRSFDILDVFEVAGAQAPAHPLLQGSQVHPGVFPIPALSEGRSCLPSGENPCAKLRPSDELTVVSSGKPLRCPGELLVAHDQASGALVMHRTGDNLLNST